MSGGTLGPAFAGVLDRELDRLVRLLEAYPDDESVWAVAGSVENSAGTLALHVAGNLEHFIGAGLGGSGYVRDREAEFGERDVSRPEMVRRIRRCQAAVRATLEGRSDAALLAAYPATLPASLGEDVSAAEFLAHLTWHLGWHLGQVDYHRRLMVGGDPV